MKCYLADGKNQRYALSCMTDWQEIDGKLTRTLEFPSFAAAMVFVNKVAEAAETADHHPDIHIHYKTVTLELWTHSAKSITDKDRKLAQEISKLSGV